MLESLRDTDLGEYSFALPVPLLVAYGNKDTRIPPEHTKHIIEFSRRRTNSLNAVPFEDATHSFRPDARHWDILAQTVSQFAVSNQLNDSQSNKPGCSRLACSASHKSMMNNMV
jgi:dienelactone hydrolase